MKIRQTSIEQTGIAIFTTEEGERCVPLFSLEVCKEANELQTYFKTLTRPTRVYMTNNLLEYRIEDEIEKFKKEHNNVVPEEYMEQLVSGFPYIEGYEARFIMSCYA